MLHLEIVRAGQRRGQRHKEAEAIFKVTYEAPSDARSIIFHAWPIQQEGCRFYRWWHPRWQEIYNGDMGCYMIVDEPDVEIQVGRDDAHFVSLRPGESWEDETHCDVPKDVKPGDKFQIIFKGTTVDWWDWGTKNDQ